MRRGPLDEASALLRLAAGRNRAPNRACAGALVLRQHRRTPTVPLETVFDPGARSSTLPVVDILPPAGGGDGLVRRVMTGEHSQKQGDGSAPSRLPFVEEVTGALVGRFGRANPRQVSEPLRELIARILSAKVPPELRKETLRAFRRAYPSADRLAQARPAEVAAAIKHGARRTRRARAIVLIARHLRERYGRVTLAPLRRMAAAEAEALLTSWPLVGKTTARDVLLCALDKAVYPVNAVGFRIARRVGWVPQEACLSDRWADELQDGVPPSLRRDLYAGMQRLGARVCTPQRPRCRRCPIVPFCRQGQRSRSCARI